MGPFIQYTLQGLAAGGFYALAALGLAVIFGMLGVVNFSHGAFYMLGAFGTALLLTELGIGFWAALAIIPVVMFAFGVFIERALVHWLVGARPALQLPAHLRPDAGARRPGQAPLRRQRDAVRAARRCWPAGSTWPG